MNSLYCSLKRSISLGLAGLALLAASHSNAENIETQLYDLNGDGIEETKLIKRTDDKGKILRIEINNGENHLIVNSYKDKHFVRIISDYSADGIGFIEYYRGEKNEL